MGSFIKSILECLTGEGDGLSASPVNEKRQLYTKESDASEEELASNILRILLTAEKPGKDLQIRVKGEVNATSWTEALAKRILDGVVAAINTGTKMGGAMKEACDKVSAIAKEFAEKHPGWTAFIVTVIALGVLAYLLPWVIEALGFGELGPIEGSFASWWQSSIGDVEERSFFAFLQRAGMTWPKK